MRLEEESVLCSRKAFLDKSILQYFFFKPAWNLIRYLESISFPALCWLIFGLLCPGSVTLWWFGGWRVVSDLAALHASRWGWGRVCGWLCVSWALTACAGWSTRSALTASSMHWLVWHSQEERNTQSLGWQQETHFFCFRAGVKIPALFSSHVSCPNTCAGRTIPYLREPCGFFLPWFHSAHFSHFIFLFKASPHWPWPTQGVCKHDMGIYEQSCCSGGAGGLLLLHLRALVTFRASYSPPNNSYYFKWTWARTQQFNPQTSCWN